jgi:hypothetical protein
VFAGMEFQIEQWIARPRSDVEGAFADADFYQALGSAPDLGSVTLLEREDQGEVVVVRFRMGFTGDISPAVRAVVEQEKLTWVTTARLRRAAHRMDFELAPDYYASLLSCSGSYAFAEDEATGARTHETVSGDLRVHVPFVAASVERVIIGGLRQHVEAEAKLLEQWVGTRHKQEPGTT